MGVMKRPRCGRCHKTIRLTRVGEWYHHHNGSVFCKPGDGTGRKAFPAGGDETVHGGRLHQCDCPEVES